MNHIHAAVLAGALALLISTEMSKGQNAITGSGLRTEEAIKQSDVIFIGHIDSMGGPAKKTSGEITYNGIKVSVTGILKGNAGAGVLVDLVARTDKKPREQLPMVNQTYTFFGNHNKSSSAISILKLTGADYHTVMQVRQLIATEPAPTP